MHPADTVPETDETADVGVLKRALASATARIWLLVLAVAGWSALVGCLWLPAASVHAHGLVVPWWLLGVGFAASEMFPVHLDIRRNTWSLTLTEIPLIIGLVLSPSIDVVVGQVAGCIVAWGLIRRQALHKLSFNTSIAGLEAVVAVIVFHAIAGNESAVHPIVWAGGFAAMIVEGVVSSPGVAIAITALTGSFPEGVIENFLISGVLASSCGTALALSAAMVLGTQPYAAILLVVIAATLAAGYHELASTRRRYSGLQLLYSFTEAMQHSDPESSVLEGLLDTTRKLLGADVSEVVIRDDQSQLIRYVLRPDGFAQADVAESASWTAAEPRNGGLLARSGTRDREAATWIKAQGWTDGMLVPLRRNGEMIGTMAVANREGDVATFDTENLKLFETLANHASVSLENHELIDQLQWEATHDTLTGLGNRREFHRCLTRALEERPVGTKLAVALVDLDRFKEINDTFGHHTGDTFLKWLGRRFKEALPPDVKAARLGGDEFAVFVYYEGTASQAAGVIERLLQPLWAEAFEIGDVKVAVDASTGVAVAPDHAEDPVTLLQRADVAMYLAKGDHSGVAGYTTERDIYSPRHVGLASALGTAIQHDELVVYFQPKLDLTTNLISGAEALVRWQHPTDGLILPDQFIPLAERTGLIVPLADVVMDQALSACAGWAERFPGTGVAVNLSIGNLTNDKLIASVRELLQRYQVPPELLVLEVTESQIMEDEKNHIAKLEALSDLGVRISVDDFGTGYASFAYLTRLPVQQVKIDKSFVGLMDVSPNDAAVVRSVIELGKDLGIEVVAEGVETEANLQILRQLGCSVAQGYHIGVPAPPVDFLTMATEWNSVGTANAATNITAMRARSNGQGAVESTG
jgi:diguanylate cyclase (GGDEF)-like protein